MGFANLFKAMAWRLAKGWMGKAFFAKDVRSGGVKSIVQGRTARRDYVLAAGALTLAVAAFAVLAGVLVSAASLAVLGFPIAAPSPGELVSWIAEVWVAVSAYAAIAVAAALLMRRRRLA